VLSAARGRPDRADERRHAFTRAGRRRAAGTLRPRTRERRSRCSREARLPCVLNGERTIRSQLMRALLQRALETRDDDAVDCARAAVRTRHTRTWRPVDGREQQACDACCNERDGYQKGDAHRTQGGIIASTSDAEF
jgi:hypothetical protein